MGLKYNRKVKCTKDVKYKTEKLSVEWMLVKNLNGDNPSYYF